MLEKLKLALQISDNSFDAELNDLIQSAIIDLNIGGVFSPDLIETTTDAILIRAIISYCAYHFEMTHGSLDKSDALKRAYDEQKAQLSMTTNYTNW